MTTYRPIHSFVIPRCKAVPTPSVREIVRHEPPPSFLLWALKPERALASNIGEVWPSECEPTAPNREKPRSLQGGRVVAYRDGLLFLPNTNLALLADAGREMKEFAVTYARYAGADFDLKAHFLSGADKEIADALGKAAEWIEELLTDGHATSRAQVASAGRDIPESVKSSLAKKDAIVLPYAELVEVNINEAMPETLWERVISNRRDLLCLVREEASGTRSAYSFFLGLDENKNLPFSCRRQSGSLRI